MTRPRFAQGFTLIELMITLVVVGILAMVGVPSYLDYVRAAERSEAITTLNDMVMRAEEFRARTNDYPDDLSDLGYNTTETTGLHIYSDNNYDYAIVDANNSCDADGDNCRMVLARVNTANHTDDECHVLLLDTSGRRYEQDKSQNDDGDDYDKYPEDKCW